MLVTQHHPLSVRIKVIITRLDISLCLHRYRGVRYLPTLQPQELSCMHTPHRTLGADASVSTEDSHSQDSALGCIHISFSAETVPFCSALHTAQRGDRAEMLWPLLR